MAEFVSGKKEGLGEELLGASAVLVDISEELCGLFILVAVFLW